MTTRTHDTWRHPHDFGQGQKRSGEARVFLVAVITGAMMVVEIGAGIAFGSMALLADGLHMGSHAVALGIAVFAYVYARRRAHDPRFAFGTGKVNALGGFAGAMLLVVFAVMMAWESVGRLMNPLPIAFAQAVTVALLGLLVNGFSAVLLGRAGEGNAHSHGHDHSHDHHHHDHNLRSAYLHVLADSLTSVCAVAALLAGRYLGWVWMDPVMGVAGALLVALWSRGLLVQTCRVLLDMQAPGNIRGLLRECLESEAGVSVVDLHVWAVGPGVYAAAVAITAESPKPASHYKALCPGGAGIAHLTLEVHHQGGGAD